MSERKINLEEILNNCVHIDDEIKPMVKNAMREACRQVLELAAENAEVKILYIHQDCMDYGIDEQSILNTINQIE